jgi:cephalosporin hydroxylase
MFRTLLRRRTKTLDSPADTAAESASREPNEAAEAYHRWFYDSLVWQRMTWMGVPILKSPGDLWNYQELIATRRPRLIVEFGTNSGGSALFFAHVQQIAGIDGRVFSVDINHGLVHASVRKHRRIELLERSSSDPRVAKRIRALRRRYRGPIFVIVDSDHRADHVYAELQTLRGVLRPGDYLVVEDGNINGHPVLPDFGPGPLEALERYTGEFPDDYTCDVQREDKFGFTFAPRGYLIRR